MQKKNTKQQTPDRETDRPIDGQAYVGRMDEQSNTWSLLFDVKNVKYKQITKRRVLYELCENSLSNNS